LYVPTAWPRIDVQALARETSLRRLRRGSLRRLSAAMRSQRSCPKSPLRPSIPGTARALDETSGLGILELFHGPTAAFKDFGCAFSCAPTLPACVHLARSRSPSWWLFRRHRWRRSCCLSRAERRINVGVLFPKGLVSPTQERQLTCWGGNVKSFAVRGTFDDSTNCVCGNLLIPNAL